MRVGDLSFEHDGAFWTAKVMLSSFAPVLRPARTIKLVAESDHDATPAQAAAARWLLASSEVAARAVLDAIIAAYPAERRVAEDPDALPEALTPATMGALLELRRVKLHEATRGDLPYLGFSFRCAWEEEHGFGLMMHGTRCVRIGGADTALLGWIADRDATAGGGRTAEENAPKMPAPAKRPTPPKRASPAKRPTPPKRAATAKKRG